MSANLTLTAIDDLDGLTFGTTAWTGTGPTTGATSAKVGSFALNTSTGNQAVTGIGFQPKVVLFFYNVRASDGTSTNALIGVGVGISSSDRKATVDRSTDAQSPSINTVANQNASCIYYPSGANIIDFVSMDSDGFTINITTTDASAWVVNYLALGGSGLTGFKTGACAAKTTTGTQAYTGVGFQPSAILFFAGKYSTDPLNTSTNGAWTFGFATSSTARGAVAWRSKNSANPQLVRHRQSKSKVGISLTDAGVFTEFDFTSFDADGFTLNFTTAGGTADVVYYLALAGPQFTASSFNQATSTGNQAITGAGFTPKASLMISANDIAANDDTTANGGDISIGAATSTTARMAIWAGDTNNVATTVSSQNLDRTKALKLIAVGATPTVTGSADHVSFDSDGQTINWSIADGTAREILVLWIG